MSDLIERLTAELAASQAREAKLREFAHDLLYLAANPAPNSWHKGTDKTWGQVLSELPSDDTALREWGAKLLEKAAAQAGCNCLQGIAADLRAGK